MGADVRAVDTHSQVELIIDIFEQTKRLLVTNNVTVSVSDIKV